MKRMGVSDLFIILSIPCLVIVLLFYSLWWKPKMLEKCLKKQGINGPAYKLVHGNAKEMMKSYIEGRSRPLGFSHDIMPYASPFHHHMAMKYGKVFVTWLGTRPQLIVLDQMLIKEILINRPGDFLKMENTPTLKLFMAGLPHYDGERWASHRKILNPAFHLEKLKHLLPAVCFFCDELIEKWDKMVDPTGSCELDMTTEFQDLTGEVISKVAFGRNSEEGRRVFQLLLEQSQLFLRELQKEHSIFLRFWPVKLNPRMVEIYEETRTILRCMIEKRDKVMPMGGTTNDDLLKVMMESNLKGRQQDKSSSNFSMSIDDIIEESIAFYFAGMETTSKLLTWTIILLSMHSSWQNQAREEVLQVIGKNNPKFEDLQHLKIVNMILQEVLRLYTPTSVIRRTYKETKLGDFSLPSNIQIMLHFGLVHHDPGEWGNDANDFNPNRFSEGVSKASKSQHSYYPFSAGPRMCIGMNLAMLEAKVVIAKILQHFYVELSPSYTHAPSCSITLAPEYGAQIILHKL